MSAGMPGTVRISLVDLSGEQTVRYFPLGIMYLKAALESDSATSACADVSVHAFLAGTGLTTMATQIAEAAPDLVGLSCQGWNIAIYRALLPTLRQLLPSATFVLGGNHVSHQGDLWLGQLPEVDIVVTGEGEACFRELVAWQMGQMGHVDLDRIPGIAYRHAGSVRHTPPRPRLSSLDEVASPFLTCGVEPGVWDVMLWETNRGCPYHCAFCFWGGAVGQRLTRVEYGRLEQELEVIARAGVSAIFICDANFGILPRDVDIARLLVRCRREYGAPTTLHVNWAKNHAGRVEEILQVLRDGGVHTNVYIALQTMNRHALALAGRDERGRPEMLRLARAVLDRGGEIGAELIFGLPGETLDDFREAYDHLLPRFPTLLLHPLWILPNTTYAEKRAEYGLVTIRPDPTVDYEGVLRHATLSVDDNRRGLRLLLADEILIGTGYARATVRALVRWAGVKPTEVLDRFEEHVLRQRDDLAARLADAFDRISSECYFHRGLRSEVREAVYADRRRALANLESFVQSLDITPSIADACLTMARYDVMLLPRADLTAPGLVTESVELGFDAHAAASMLLSEGEAGDRPARDPVRITVSHEGGFANHRRDAIDLSAHWRGRVCAVASLSIQA